MDRYDKLRYYISDAQSDLKRGDMLKVERHLEKALTLLRAGRRTK